MTAVLRAEIFALSDFPLVKQGDDLVSLIKDALDRSGLVLQDRDIVVIAQKIVSIAESRMVHLDSVTPSPEAFLLAKETARDPRLCQLIIEHSKRVLYLNGRAIITEDELGLVNTSAGIDRSNSGSKKGEIAILLPADPDASAQRIRDEIRKRLGQQVAVIIQDSCGRPFRKGSVGMAIGIAGIAPVEINDPLDLGGRQIHSEEARVDELASAASMLMGQAAERRPVVIIRGVSYRAKEQTRVQDLLRPPEEDLIWLREGRNICKESPYRRTSSH